VTTSSDSRARSIWRARVARFSSAFVSTCSLTSSERSDEMLEAEAIPVRHEAADWPARLV
jgi:hypothetical protein